MFDIPVIEKLQIVGESMTYRREMSLGIDEKNMETRTVAFYVGNDYQCVELLDGFLGESWLKKFRVILFVERTRNYREHQGTIASLTTLHPRLQIKLVRFQGFFALSVSSLIRIMWSPLPINYFINSNPSLLATRLLASRFTSVGAKVAGLTYSYLSPDDYELKQGGMGPLFWTSSLRGYIKTRLAFFKSKSTLKSTQKSKVFFYFYLKEIARFQIFILHLCLGHVFSWIFLHRALPKRSWDYFSDLGFGVENGVNLISNQAMYLTLKKESTDKQFFFAAPLYFKKSPKQQLRSQEVVVGCGISAAASKVVPYDEELSFWSRILTLIHEKKRIRRVLLRYRQDSHPNWRVLGDLCEQFDFPFLVFPRSRPVTTFVAELDILLSRPSTLLEFAVDYKPGLPCISVRENDEIARGTGPFWHPNIFEVRNTFDAGAMSDYLQRKHTSPYSENYMSNFLKQAFLAS